MYTCCTDDKLKFHMLSHELVFLLFSDGTRFIQLKVIHSDRDNVKKWCSTLNVIDELTTAFQSTFNSIDVRYINIEIDLREGKVFFGTNKFEDDTKLKHLKLSGTISRRQNKKETETES